MLRSTFLWSLKLSDGKLMVDLLLLQGGRRQRPPRGVPGGRSDAGGRASGPRNADDGRRLHRRPGQPARRMARDALLPPAPHRHRLLRLERRRGGDGGMHHLLDVGGGARHQRRGPGHDRAPDVRNGRGLLAGAPARQGAGRAGHHGLRRRAGRRVVRHHDRLACGARLRWMAVPALHVRDRRRVCRAACALLRRRPRPLRS